MRTLFVLLTLTLLALPTQAQPTGVSGLDLGSGRITGVSGLDLGSGRAVDFGLIREAVLTDAQMELVKGDRDLAALFRVTGDNTVAAARGLTLYGSTDRDGGCSETVLCIILIGGGVMHVPFSGDGGLGGTRLSFLMPQQLGVSEEQAEVIGNGPMADHLRIDGGSVTGGRDATLFSTNQRGDCRAGACLIGLEQDGFLSMWAVP
ncbi:MAG: hypothetical protein AAF624_15735 [Bacteroidota bacterium]